MSEEPTTLEQYTSDLTEEAKADPDKFIAIDRDAEISSVVINLNRRTKNNPILIGEAGVGKTAIVEGLARLIALNEAGPQLNHKHIRVLQVAALGQQDLATKFLKIIDDLKATKGNVILFIDEVHTIMGSDQSGGAMDLGDVLKPAMARGDIQLIGSTTLDEYDKFIEKDPALTRRFQEVIVNEPSRTSAITILQGIQNKYAKYHHVTYTPDAIIGCVDLSIRYIADRFLPDKAIDLLDQSGATCATHNISIVDLKAIAIELQRMTGIPVTSILQNDSTRLSSLRKKLGRRVKGQSQAIAQVVDAVSITKAGLQAPDKPLSSFLFLGTTGTGKTELAKSLTEIMFDSEDNMIRFDMSEFSNQSSLDRFQGLLTDAIKRKPYCILLFDEIEKACADVHDRLLQVLDDGELRDRRGRRANFRNAIIIMTTNLAAELITDKQTFDREDNGDVRKQLAFEKEVNFELTNVFRPEFINRIDHKVVFNVLSRDVIREIAKKNLAVLAQRLSKRGNKLEYDNDVIDFLADVGTDEENGARPLARAIETEMTAPLSMLTLNSQERQTYIAKVVGEASSYDPRGSRVIKFYGKRSKKVS